MPSKKYVERKTVKDIKFLTTSVDAVKNQVTIPRNTLVYYGYLNSFNSAQNGWVNEAVAQDMAKYSMIVFGDGVEVPTHPDYANTQIIIPRIKALNPNCLIFGYVDATIVIGTFQTKVDQWNTLAIHGIFMDKCGYDFALTRSSFNTKVDYIHGKTSAKIAFSNAWSTDHILGLANDVSYPNTTFNSSLLESNLTSNDWILLESFPINTTAYSGTQGYEPKADWYTRGSKIANLRATYPINVAGIGVINNDNAGGQNLFNFGYISSLMFALDAFGTSDTSYASGSAAVTYWVRPSAAGIGAYIINPAVVLSTSDADIYLRYVDSTMFMLDFSSAAQLSGIFRSTQLNAIVNATGAGDVVAKVNEVLNALRSYGIIKS
jgi:hypothetical protein